MPQEHRLGSQVSLQGHQAGPWARRTLYGRREMEEDITGFIASVSNHSAGHEPGQLLSRALGCVWAFVLQRAVSSSLKGERTE